MNAAWIRVEYSLDSLADISPTDFEATLHDALKQRWPGALVNIAQTSCNKYNGENADGSEIAREDIHQISQDVFRQLCEGV